MQTYTLNELDLFAAYVIPLDAWYLIPATLLVGGDHISDAMLCPVAPPVKKARLLRFMVPASSFTKPPVLSRPK